MSPRAPRARVPHVSQVPGAGESSFAGRPAWAWGSALGTVDLQLLGLTAWQMAVKCPEKGPVLSLPAGAGRAGEDQP